MGDSSREEDLLKTQQAQRRNAFNLILMMLDRVETPKTKLLMDEMLHSIFFLAKICPIPFSPREIIPDEEMLKGLMKMYPRPFDALSQLPKRTPFSSVLDMIILKENPENESQIKTSLQGIVVELEQTSLVSSTICVSQRASDSARHYGISMSTTGSVARKIMIAASCCGPWDDYVAGAVMTYRPRRQISAGVPHIQGTFKLPDYVRCEAFDISNGEIKPPCRSCGDLFGLPTRETKGWPYGNCAEVESVSNLLKHEEEVKGDVEISDTVTDEIRKRVQDDVRYRLKKVLQDRPIFIRWGGDYYNAQ